jgi:predicted SnoaL-like aldol condensation-catalyzing enzyme
MRILVMTAAASVILISGASQAAETPQEKANIRVATEFYNAEMNAPNVENFKKLTTADFKEHDPHQKGDRDSLLQAMQTRQSQAPEHVDIVRTFADGNYVIFHGIGKHKPGDPKELGTVVVEILRLENGKVAEQWDVAQPVMEKEKSPNKYPMY